MPLIGIPTAILPELLYILAKMGHGDRLVIADANFPSDSVAQNCICKDPVRVIGSTDQLLKDILTLFPLDQYKAYSAMMMDRVDSDKARNLHVPAYSKVETVVQPFSILPVKMIERFQFYEIAKQSFAVVQSTDTGLYANVIISKGIIS